MTTTPTPASRAENTAPISADLRRFPVLSEHDAGLLEQAASMLEGLHNDERNRGNCSTAEGAACSADAVRRLAVQLVRAAEPAQGLHQIAEPTPATYMAVDDACDWAWQQVRQEVGTMGWTRDDSFNFYGFFLWGWIYRGKYEAQRAAGTAYMQRVQAMHAAPASPAQEDAPAIFPLQGDETDEEDLSPWQPGSSKPATDGRYLRDFDEGMAISWFTDSQWSRDGLFASGIQDAPWRGLSKAPAQAQQDAPAAVAVPWENFPAYLIDHCEGDTITEEGLQHALAAMLADPQYAAAPASQDAQDAARLDAMEQYRMSVVPEHEGPWDASIYGEDDKPAFVGSGATARAAIDAALAAQQAGEKPC